MDKKNVKDKQREMDTEFKDITKQYQRQLVKVKVWKISQLLKHFDTHFQVDQNYFDSVPKPLDD